MVGRRLPRDGEKDRSRPCGRSGREAKGARLRARLAPPDDLVGVQHDPDGGDQRRARRAPAPPGRPGTGRRTRRSRRGGRDPASGRRAGAAATNAERYRARPDAEGERRDRVELVPDMRQRHLHREGEERDPGDHRQMQVGVDVARERDAIGPAAARSAAAARGPGRSRSTRARTTPRRRSPSTAATTTPAPRSVLRAPRPIAISDSPIAMITISPWRSTKCAGARRQPSTGMTSGPRNPTASATTTAPTRNAPSTKPAARISVAPARLDGAIRRIAANRSGSARAGAR